jgi:c-di-GMP-related signal transduction protein
MITKRHIYEPLERIESAIDRLYQIAKEGGSYKSILEVIERDLSKAREKLEYVQEIAS